MLNINIEKDEISEYYSFKVDGDNKRYLLSDFTVMHV